MNNEDHFQNEKNKPDQTPAGAEWAEIVDRRGQPPKNSDGAEPVEPVDLTPQQLDDLELDGQLRMLGKMSTPDDSFVSRVVDQAQSESNPVSQNRPRLPVIGPSLVPGTSETPVTTTETSEAVDETPEKVNATPETVNEISDAVHETPETIREASEAITESSFASTVDDRGELPSASLPTEVTSAEVNQRRPVALLALLASIAFVGCFLGSMWWYSSAPEIADSPVPSASDGKFVRLKGIAESKDDLRQDALEISPAVDGDTNRFSAGEAFAEHSKDEGPGVGSVVALPKSAEEVDQKDGNNLESTNNANSDSKLVDTKQKLDSAVTSTDDGMLGLGDEGNLKDKSIAGDSSEDPLWDSIDWNLALQFRRNGVGSAKLNGEPVKAIFLKDNAVFLLRKIAGEFQRRVRFLENRLGSKVSGSIAVRKAKYHFDDLSELDATISNIEAHISKLNVDELSVADLMDVRVGYRKEIFNNRNMFESINLAHKNLRFYTEDEAFTISSVLSATEGVLRDLAKERLEWAEDDDLPATELKLKNRIKAKDFVHFANGAALSPPDPKFTDQSVAGIQNLGPSELQRMLQGAPSVDLFRTVDEFQQAKDFVYSNGPPEMKMRLSIDKIDRTLNGAIVVTEAAQDVLRAQKTREVRDLRVAITRAERAGDGIPMEPLKAVLPKRIDLQGLPLVMGKECRSDAKETSELSQVSSAVGLTIGRFNGSLGSRDAAQNDAFRNLTIKKMVTHTMKDQADNPSSQKLKTIDQILQIDHPRLRLDMIGELRMSGSGAAVELMVDKAKFDLEPEVRIAATAALAELDPEDIRGLLLEGLKYPWHVVAEHSAEALVRLDDQDAVPQLIEMLDLPHPHSPFEDNGEVVQHELVGINHLRNCLLCHAPSMSSFDSARGLVPHVSTPLPPHYYDTRAVAADVPYAVRADVTYLEQDFSVVQPVKNSGPWPSEQRIDYVVQKKKLTPAKAKKVAVQIGKSPNRNRDAIVFALQELTGEKPADNSSGHWKMITAGRDQNGG